MVDAAGGTRQQGPADRQPLISVAVLNYNYAEHLPLCLDSILGQSLSSLEVVVVNDASTDHSLEVLAPYLDEPRVTLIDHQENKGFAASLREASAHSDTPYLTVVSADDWLVDERALESMVESMEADPEVVMAFGAYGHYYDIDVRSHLSRFAPDSKVIAGIDALEGFTRTGIPLHSGTVLRRSAYEAIGGYWIDLRYALDVQIFYGLCQVGRVATIGRELVAWRRHQDSMSVNPAATRTTIEEVLRIIDWSFAMMSDEEREANGWLRGRARKRALTMYANDAAFSGQIGRAWRLLAVGARVSPIETVAQKATAMICLRSTVGRRAFEAIDRRRARPRLDVA